MEPDKAEETTRLHEETNGPFAKDIIRVTSYHRHDYDLAVIRTDPKIHDPIRDVLTQTTNIIILDSSLGSLDVFPLEIVYEICLYLDIQSLFRFHRVNRRARQLASASRYYKAVVTHAVEAVYITLRTGIASWYTISDLYAVLCIKNCESCDAFGGFIFLPLFMRCCFTCIADEALPYVLPASNVRPYLKRRAGPISRLVPTVKSLPGFYSLEETQRKRRFELILENSISTIFPSAEVEKSPGKVSRDTELQPYMVTTALPYLDNESDVIEKGVSCSGCQIALEKDLWSSRVKSNVCDKRDRVYSHEGFMEHFKSCQEARKLWDLSEGGTIEPDVPQFVKKGGSAKKRDVVMSFRGK
ncbi:hypothetical protein AbraIFM66950_004401 [Aspergillus brasiliensis]|nr:hypothetical protein AbraIFM66950_004401 [Aspergillus brasiliensis]